MVLDDARVFCESCSAADEGEAGDVESLESEAASGFAAAAVEEGGEVTRPGAPASRSRRELDAVMDVEAL